MLKIISLFISVSLSSPTHFLLLSTADLNFVFNTLLSSTNPNLILFFLSTLLSSFFFSFLLFSILLSSSLTYHRLEKELVILLDQKVRTIQKAYRTYGRLMYSSARWQSGLVRRLLRYKAATMIESYARVRLARR